MLIVSSLLAEAIAESTLGPVEELVDLCYSTRYNMSATAHICRHIATKGSNSVNHKTADKIAQIVRRSGVIRPRDMDAHGIPRKYIHLLHHKGVLSRVARGLYVLKGASPSENRTMAEVCKRVPSGVVCLLSALQFHRLTTQAPHQVWLAIGHKSRRPNEPKLPIRIVRFSGQALTAGIDQHTVEGVPVRVFSPAKTIADCFKFRNKIGLDIAIEALRECIRSRKGTMDELWMYAKMCRVANVMKPYLESLV